MIPDNVFAAATNGDILPLVVFSVLFALALGAHRGSRPRAVVDACSKRSRDALLVDHRLGACGSLRSASSPWPSPSARRPADAAFAGLGHYVVLISVIGILVTLAGYPLAHDCRRGIGSAVFTRR